MNFKCWLGGCLLLATAGALLAMSSCAHDEQLESIQIQPGTATFLSPDPNAQILFTAFGSFIHPTENRDITSTVTWKTNVPQLVTVNDGIVSPTGVGCGVANVSATAARETGSRENVVVGYATITVNDSSNPDCPGNNSTKVLTVTLMGGGSGTVTSSPAGIDCPLQTCGTQFLTGTTIQLNATADAGSSFVGWGQGCSSSSGNQCTVILNTDTNVTASFQ